MTNLQQASSATGKYWFDGLDVCVVSDALDAIGRPGAVTGIRPVWEGARTVGRVITMTVSSAPGQRAERHLGALAIDRAEPGDVVVVQQEGAEHSVPMGASWGGLLSQAAALRGIVGIIVDGACRDVDEIRGIRLPVHARSVVPFTARRRYVETAVGAKITVGGVAVATGDYVLADGSGVAFVGADQVRTVLALARRMLAREQLMLQDLRAGTAVSEVLAHDYEEMLDDD
jgi:4-hydroxy-4-methyl-2-oxoglutarate aldolase